MTRDAGAAEAGLLRDMADAAPDAIIAYDHAERVVFVNPAFRALFPRLEAVTRPGVTLEKMLRHGIGQGQFPEAGTRPETQMAWLASQLAAHRAPGPAREVALPENRWAQLREARSAQGHLVCTATDVTALKTAEASARRHVEEDGLTGLGNRAALLRKLAGLHRGQRSGDARTACLLLLDLDHFKAINDSLGHPAGDALLCEIARRGRGLLRANDTFARLGGDEFAILLPGIGTPAQALSFIGRLRARLEQPLAHGDASITPSLSIGASLFPDDAEDGQALLRSADTALYQAKREGRHCHSFFDRSIAEMLDRKARLTAALRHAIAADAIEVALQPQLRARDRGHAGFEALARWSEAAHPVPPSEFIPVAEEMGLIVPLGRLVLRRALGAMRELLRLGLEPGRVAVNVATAQLLTDGFAREVGAELEAHGLAPARLELELTESTLLDRSAERVAQVLQEFRAMGVSIALDDFGTGYASLAHLTQFRVDRLKIDRRFVREIGAAGSVSPIARSIIGLAHGLGLEAVAEGVETEAQMAYLHQLGCDLVQGYLTGRPLGFEQAVSYLRAAQTVPERATN